MTVTEVNAGVNKDESGVLVASAHGVTEITLNRPNKLNAFCEPMHETLHAALLAAANNKDIRCILLTGAGRGFSAGQDLGERNTSQQHPDLGDTLERFYNPIIRTIRTMPKPVICAVNGVAAGAGANIALACDIVLAAQSAKFTQAFVKIGLLPDSGGTWLLPHLLGAARATALAMTGEAISAERAQNWGLIWRVIADEDLMVEARTLARQFATGPTISYSLIKQAIHAAATHSLDEHLDLERDLQRQAGKTKDYAEGVTAFFEKRTPEFTGQS